MKAINNLSVYFIGIGGSGMMPLALMAARCGYRVGGSDRKLDAGKRGALEKAGIVVHSPPDANQIQDQDFVVYSSAIRRDHPEYVRASQCIDTTDMRLMHRMQFLNECLSRYNCQFAVAGTHGKTSTASMLGWALLQLKLQPGILVGGRPIYLPDGIHVGPGDCAVYETDESDGSFLESRARF
ncbi:MAG: UDP-N-acetylmuramate--alanine ligase, partial [Leptospiraceae bacterium]|nr:UDP-N-acetylmuramate--alanine ligase [Leptospiraceae bacterium]